MERPRDGNGGITKMPKPHATFREGGVPGSLPGTPSAAAALADAEAGRLPPSPEAPPSPAMLGTMKPGEKRLATEMEILALRNIELNETVLKLFNQQLEMAKRIVDQEAMIHGLQVALRTSESENLSRTIISARAKYGFNADQFLEEDFATGQYSVVQKAPKAPPQNPSIG